MSANLLILIVYFKTAPLGPVTVNVTVFVPVFNSFAPVPEIFAPLLFATAEICVLETFAGTFTEKSVLGLL